MRGSPPSLQASSWKSIVICDFGYASVRPFLYFDHFHIFDLFCTSTTLLRPFLYFDLFCTSTTLLRPFLYFDHSTSTSLLRTLYFCLLTSTSEVRPFLKSGFLLFEKYRFGRCKILVDVKFGQ